MMKHVASRFRAARLQRGLTVEELARLAGYRNTRKISARIARFEQDGTINDELLSRIADALEIEYSTIERLLALDDQEPIYAIQRQDDRRYLTPAYLQWSVTVENAQRCDLEAAQSIEGWLTTIGIAVTIVQLAGAARLARTGLDN